MKSFPMFLRTTGRRVVIVGGGEQAAQKARLIQKTDATLVLVAQTLEPELEGLVQEGKAQQVTQLNAKVFEGAAMAIVGSGCPGLDGAAHALAKAAHCPVNVVDQPHLCDLTVPALVDRDPIVVAIGSEGTSPVLTREIKTRMEEILPQNLGGLAALAGRLRPAVARCIPRAKRRAFWGWVFRDGPRDMWVQGAEREAAKVIKDAIARGSAPSSEKGGHVSLVGSGSGVRDLMTLRAVQRLQEADVIFYDRTDQASVLELARRDAERVFLNESHASFDDTALMLSEARKGARIVRLVGGTAADIATQFAALSEVFASEFSVEVVPGVDEFSLPRTGGTYSQRFSRA